VWCGVVWCGVVWYGGLAHVGSVYVYSEVGVQWSVTALLVAADAIYGDQFGAAVCLWGSSLAVGAYGKKLTSDESIEQGR
jgi:hypothetical protein